MKITRWIYCFFIFFIVSLTLMAAAGEHEVHYRRVKGLLMALEDSDERVRMMALERLCEKGLFDSTVLKADEVDLIENALNKSDDIKHKLITSLLLDRFGRGALAPADEFIKYLEIDMPSASEERWLVKVLSALPLSAGQIERLERLLDSSITTKRYSALLILVSRSNLEESTFDKVLNLISEDEDYLQLVTLEPLFKKQNFYRALKRKHIPQLLTLFELQVDVKSYCFAIEALYKMDIEQRERDRLFSTLRSDSSSNVRIALYFTGFIDLGDEVINGLKESSSLMKTAAFTASANFKGGSKFVFPYILEVLKKGDYDVLPEALYSLSYCYDLNMREFAELLKLLFSEDLYTRERGLKALSVIKNLPYKYTRLIEDIAKDEDDESRIEAIKALGGLNSPPQSTLSLLRMLFSESSNPLRVRSVAMQSLAALGELKGSLLNEDSLTIYLSVVGAGQVSEVDSAYKEMLLNTVESGELSLRIAALRELAAQAVFDKTTVERVLNLLTTAMEMPELREGVLHYLEKLGTLEEPSSLLKLINCTYLFPEESHVFRFYAYYMAGRAEWVGTALRWAVPRDELPRKVEYGEARETLELFSELWESCEGLSAYRADLEAKVAILISKKGVKWTKDEIPLIKKLLTELEEVDSTHSASLEQELQKLDNPFLYHLFNLLKLLLLHLLFWLALIFIYPYSPHIQAIFFWNPYLRRILGLGYVNFALTWIPFLRSKLFEPFKGALMADAMLDKFNRASYFKELFITDETGSEQFPLMEKLRALKGQIILEGESGLGKSLFLKYLLLNSRRLAVYLPARRCEQGVIEAIREKLHGAAGDSRFLQSLIYSGALDIYIDGLNEVNADTRERITTFVESNFSGNIIIATQPIEWKGPSNVPVYTLLPLKEEQLLDFLLAKEKSLPEDVALKGEEYKRACREYLDSLPEGVDRKSVYLKRLSNPMDLTITARIIAQGEEPDLLKLQEQHYSMMATDYKKKNMGSNFPLLSFASHVYRMRLKDKKRLSEDEFSSELVCMERYRMVLKREDDYYFRHDKVMDYFIVYSFLENSELPEKHIEDSRFRGVYYLLATLLPLEDAMILREKLLLYAAKSKEHILSDSFIKLLHERGGEADSFKEI